MLRLFNYVLAIIGVIMTGIGLAGFHGKSELIAVALMGIALVVVAFLSDRRLERRLQEQRRVDVAHRIAELTRVPWDSLQTLKVRGSIWTPIASLLAAGAGAALTYLGVEIVPTHWPVAVAGLFLFSLGAIAFPRSLAGIGKSACVLARDGFATPIHGRIPWSEVTGIDLQKITTRSTTIYRLLFRIERYRAFLAQMHWTERLMAGIGLGMARRGIVGVRLADAREKPETIYSVARFLWKESTGRDYPWNPAFSDALNEAARRVGELGKRHTSVEELRRRLAENPQGALQQLKREASAEVQQLNTDLATMSAEGRRMNFRVNVMVGVAVLFLLLALALPWLQRL